MATITGGLTKVDITNATDTATIALHHITLAGNAVILGMTKGRIVKPSGTYTDNTNGGVVFEFSAIDMTVARRLFYAEMRADKELDVLVDSTGPCLFALTSGTGANMKEACWAICGGSGDTHDTQQLSLAVRADKSDTAAFYNGSYDPAAVSGVGIGCDLKLKADAHQVYLAYTGYLDPYVLTGGTSGTPATFKDITDEIKQGSTSTIFSPTENIHASRGAWIIGDGATETHFDETLKVFEFYGSFDATQSYINQSHVDGDDIGYERNASASDSSTFTLCNWIDDTAFFWNTIGSTAASIEYVSCTIKGPGLSTIVDGHTFDFCTFDSRDTITTTAPTITNSTIKNSSATVALDIVDSVNFTDNTLSNNTTAMRFDFDASDTVVLDNITFSGNTTDIEYTGSGVLTVQPTNGTTIGTTLASGTGSIDVSASPVTLKIIVKDPSGSLITDSSVNVLVLADSGGALSVDTQIIKGLTDINGEVSDTRAYTGNQPIKGWVRKSSGSPYYRQFKIIGEVSAANGLTLTVKMVSDE
jgi:hypothetical protein